MARYERPSKVSDRRRRMQYVARKAKLVGIIAFVAVALVIADRVGLFGNRPDDDFEKYHGKSFTVARVIDGDTLDIDVLDRDGEPTRIRLWGIDTPETVKPDMPPQHFGPQASRFTKQVAGGKIVRLELVRRPTRGRHGRLLAYVFLPDGCMLNRLLVAEGYGYADPRYEHPYRREFRLLQRQAKDAGAGLWRDVTRADLPYYYQDMKLPIRNETSPTHSTDTRPSAGL